MSFWGAVAFMVRKDLLLEWRSRARLNATVFFVVMTLLLFSFAIGPDSVVLGRLAPGFLWLALFLASVLLLGESLRVETESQALDTLRLMPVSPAALFVGKAVANTVFLTFLGLVALPVMFAIYNATAVMSLGWLVLALVLGAAAICAPGTLYATMAVQAKARDVLLPLLLFPVLVPGLLAAVSATTLVFTGDPLGQLPSWLALLFAFDVVYWALGPLLFGRVVEE